MQSASSNFTAEMSGGNVVWAPPRVFADWARDGYGADGSIDDLSAQVGSDFVVSHHLDDGLPEQVTFVSGVGSPTLATPLVYGRGNRASTYFSPYNASSPVSGFDRDVAPVRLDWGAVTAAGMEYVRLFTGQMMNVKVRGQGAELEAMSATRVKLRKLIQPPAVNGAERGLNATWPVSYALQKSGVYVSPPPRSMCRAWYPMHGSLTPIIPDVNGRPDLTTDPPGGYLSMYERVANSLITQVRPNFLTNSPFLMAADGFVTSSKVRFLSDKISLDSGPDILSKAGSRGRIEMWVRGDAANFNAAPGGSGAYPSNPVDLKITNNGGTYARFGIGADRKVFLTIYDGTSIWTIQTAATLPTDGAWYFIGGAWKLEAGGSFCLREFSGATSAYVGPVMTLFPNTDSIQTGSPTFTSYLPTAELQVTSGSDAWGDTVVGAWLADPEYAWTAGATIRPSALELEALAEPVPREAWEFIGSYAQAELATMRTDEVDKFNYLTMGYWAEPAQQVTVDALSTSANMADIDIDADPSKVYNVVSVNYSDVRIQPTSQRVLEVRDARDIPPGKTTLKLALDKPALNIFRGALIPAGASSVAAGNGEGFTANTSKDGSGTYLGAPDITVTVTDWTPGTLTLLVNNTTGVTRYFANSGSVPTITVLGTAVTINASSAVGRDQTSIDRRGERALVVSLPAIQRRTDAQAIANELAARLMKPRPVIGEVELFPDPRRQPGDLVTLTDAVNTGASGLWRVQSIAHNRSGDSYTQRATIRRAMPVAVEGVATEGDYTAGP